MDGDILVSTGQMMRAFTEWDRRFRLDPKAFQSDVERLLNGETADDYGREVAPYFQTLLKKKKKKKKKKKNKKKKTTKKKKKKKIIKKKNKKK